MNWGAKLPVTMSPLPASSSRVTVHLNCRVVFRSRVFLATYLHKMPSSNPGERNFGNYFEEKNITPSVSCECVGMQIRHHFHRLRKRLSLVRPGPAADAVRARSGTIGPRPGQDSQLARSELTEVLSENGQCRTRSGPGQSSVMDFWTSAKSGIAAEPASELCQGLRDHGQIMTRSGPDQSSARVCRPQP